MPSPRGKLHEMNTETQGEDEEKSQPKKEV